MTVSVIVSMLCIGTVPASAFDANQGNDIYFYAEPQTLDEAVASMIYDGTGYEWELTYALYGDPNVYYGFASGNIESRIMGMGSFIEYYDTNDYAANLSFPKIGTGRPSYQPMSLNAYAAAATKYPQDGIQFAFISRVGANRDPRQVLQEGNSFGLEPGLLGEWTIKYYITDLEAFKAAAKAKTLHFTADIYDDANYGQDLVAYKLSDTGGIGTELSLQRKEYTPPKPLDYYLTVDEPQPATDPYYNYTGDDANGYTITFTEAYKNAILSNTDYTSDDGATTYWSANDPIKNPQYNNKTVSSAANLFSGMALAKVDLSEFNLSDAAMSNMFAGFQGTGNGIPAIGVAADDATATKYNLTDTGIDKTTLYFGNVTILNYNDGNAYNYVYDDRATTDTDEATTAVTIGNAGNNKQFVNITGKYFAGFENPDKTDALVTIDYSDAVKTKDLDAYLTAQQTTDKGNDVLRLQLNAKAETPNGINLSKAMAQRVTKNGTNSIRFIALIDTGYADYKETGFVLSGVGMNPTRQAGYQYKSTNTIYKKLRALDTTSNKPGVVLMDIEKMNGIFGFANGAGFEYTELKIPAGKENTTYYATPYIVLADDTIVYGETKATTFNVLAENDQKSVG